MSTKMKGLLKGLRYISNIFEEQGEKELEIGFPTDVKHVAHIGWDGPSSNPPSWISQFKGEGGSSEASSPNDGDVQNVPRVRDPRLPAVQERRASTGSDTARERRRSDKPKGGSRRQKLVGGSPIDSPRMSSTSETSRAKSPRGLDSPARDSTGSGSGSGPKARKKKPKSSSSSKSKLVDQTGDGTAIQ